MERNNCNSCPARSAATSTLNCKEFETLEQNSTCVNFRKGELIFKQGALSLNISYLRSGIVKTHMRRLQGERILRIFKAPAYLGLTATLEDKINQFSVTALEDVTVCFIDTALFKEFILRNGKFAYEIIKGLGENESFDYQKYTQQSQKQVPGIIAETLSMYG